MPVLCVGASVASIAVGVSILLSGRRQSGRSHRDGKPEAAWVVGGQSISNTAQNVRTVHAS